MEWKYIIIVSVILALIIISGITFEREQETCPICGSKLDGRGYYGDRKFCPKCGYEN